MLKELDALTMDTEAIPDAPTNKIDVIPDAPTNAIAQ